MSNIRDAIERKILESRRVRTIIAVVVLLVAAILIALAIKKALTRDLDLYVLLNAARRITFGIDIYSSPSPTGAYYLYLPFIAVLFVPFTFVAEQVAGIAWTLASILLIGWSLHAWIKLLAGERYSHLSAFEKWALHLLPIIFCFDAISSEIGNGQVNCLILATTVFAIRLGLRDSQLKSGILLGLAFVAKLLNAPVIAYHLFTRRFRPVVGAALALAIGILLPALFVGILRDLDYTSYWLSTIAFNGDLVSHRSGFAGNTSLAAVLFRLFSDIPAFVSNGVSYSVNIATIDGSVLRWAGPAVAILTLGWLGIYAYLYGSRRPLVSYFGGVALAFCLAPVMIPIAERPHFLMLLPAYAYASYVWIHLRLNGKPFYAFLIAAFVLSTLTLKVYVGDFLGNAFWTLGAPTWAAVCLAAAIFVAANRLKGGDLTAEE
ncbi:MAG TPA: glycosyltransferase family 87 protein [Pyrinomonadaceae bacterium]|jgi:hypothetical protein|nr:glycosyltransferase family 87 protein [Pyrinomonadaceae bacterium]